MRILSFAPLLVASVLASVACADTITYDFDFRRSPTGQGFNVEQDMQIAEAQIKLTVVGASLDSDEAIFRISNIGPEQSTVTQIVFEDGALLNIATIAGFGAGVLFEDSTPTNGNPNHGIPFLNSARYFEAERDGSVHLGVDPGEHVDITFNLLQDKTFSSVIDALNKGFTDGYVPGESLRIGIHVQNFADGGSEKLIAVPTPTSFASLLGLGVMGLMIGYRRRRRRDQAV